MESANNDARKWPILPFDVSRDFIISRKFSSSSRISRNLFGKFIVVYFYNDNQTKWTYWNSKKTMGTCGTGTQCQPFLSTWVLTPVVSGVPLSTIFPLYRGGHFYWWRKLEDPEKTMHRPAVNQADKLYHVVLLAGVERWPKEKIQQDKQCNCSYFV
jgi:hypothetical protein